MENALQRTYDWFADRLGKVTASRIGDLMAKTKSGYSTSRENYKVEKILEILTGQQGDTFTNAAMQWGTDQEPNAKAAYEFEQGVTIEDVGFISHPTIEKAGASPDGLIGDDGLIEVKCPNSATHLKTLLNGSIERKYILQMQWQMACTGRQWCDFVSYDPRFDIERQLFITRVVRDDVLIAEIESEVEAFLEEVQGDLDRLDGK